ncbi:TetR/AcrR family transcriptional regulator [Palleronia sp. LCG004]|uniref:TetR/AcrR family transcriptional regulator n=1 Tax=Palleronia sp. LCG004 TaxID=3079304 RepID=UPI00294289C9|nr:TetR/AcrR family transcriptional regulator [Palleronia sp. LCG004]WOI58290.1 TetR/AcrR family transcriptional regulator [Palleronia sp. LCG004]
MAGRPRSIDRDKVLNAAEALVIAEGASALSFDAVAKAAGITKGGVQYAFGTRDNLIRSMITRWEDAFDADVARRSGPDPSGRALILGHLAAMRDAEEADHSRAAVAVTTLLQHPDRLSETRDWYAARLAGLDLTDPDDRRLATSFLAAEGAFLLKAFGLLALSETEWKALFDDMLSANASDPADAPREDD